MILKSELTYEMEGFFAHADVNHTGKRYYTYLNDGGVGAYTLLNAGVGYNFSNITSLKKLTLQADVTNLTDQVFYSTIDSNGFTASDRPAARRRCCLARHGSSSSR
ncbi:MAG: TonB-dependent receptor [Proteobacteria bacterium]|nr:TonB-dependent receptor [Pseudomonadota bacterium]